MRVVPFRYRLARVLDWRKGQCRVAGNQLALAQAAVVQLTLVLNECRVSQIEAARQLITSPYVAPCELHAMEECRRAAQLKEKHLLAKLDEARQSVALRMEDLKQARLRVRLLERLRELRLAEHNYAAIRELEELASDTYLAKVARDL
jgi:hypothetical protein